MDRSKSVNHANSNRHITPNAGYLTIASFDRDALGCLRTGTTA